MSSKNMDVIQNLSYKSVEEPLIKSNGCESKIYQNCNHGVTVFRALQSLREDSVLCDIRLKADDDTIVFVHKVVLVSASPYFRAMFTSFNESNKDNINIREIDSTILKLLVDYIYTGVIMVTEQNVQVLLLAANLLQVDYVKEVCVEFLQAQLNPTNCLGIREFAHLHDCLELFSSSNAHIKKHFLDVVKSDEFLSLSTEELIKLISGNVLNAPEEKVYECVINWVKQELDNRFYILPKLMEYVRLPLLSIEYISINVVEEPLLKNSPKCKDFIIEAFQLHMLKTKQLFTIPQTIRNTPRQSGQKVILLFTNNSKTNSSTSWYDPVTNLWQISPEMRIGLRSFSNCLALIKERFVISINKTSYIPNLEVLDLSLQSPRWKLTVSEMLVKRKWFGVGVLDDNLYAVGGAFGVYFLNTAEVFNISIQKWQTISSMSTKRSNSGVGVLNNRLYMVGGCNASPSLKSVECYDPSLDTWASVAEMSECRNGVGVAVLDGIMYAVGGENETELCHKSVEAYSPSTGVWYSIADMHFARWKPEVFALDGLLYVMGGRNNQYLHLDSVEIYNPNTNSWSMELSPKNIRSIFAGVVVDKAPHFITT